MTACNALVQSSDVSTGNGDLRHRRTAGTAMTDVEEDIDTVLRHHHQVQDKLADEMVHMARNLKENARLAGNIVKEDTKVRPACNINARAVSNHDHNSTL